MRSQTGPEYLWCCRRQAEVRLKTLHEVKMARHRPSSFLHFYGMQLRHGQLKQIYNPYKFKLM